MVVWLVYFYWKWNVDDVIKQRTYQRKTQRSSPYLNFWREPTVIWVSCCTQLVLLTVKHFRLIFLLKQFNRGLSCWWCVSVQSEDDPILIDGDISIDSEAERNADPCTSRGCMWGKWSDGKVYVPYYISNHFCKSQKVGWKNNKLETVIWSTFYDKTITSLPGNVGAFRHLCTGTSIAPLLL